MYTSDLEIVRLSNIFLYGSWILISLKSLISSFHNDKNKYTYFFPGTLMIPHFIVKPFIP